MNLTNTSQIPDETIRRWVKFILKHNEGGRRLPSGCEVVFKTSRIPYTYGRAHYPRVVSVYYQSSNGNTNWTLTGGRVTVRVPAPCFWKTWNRRVIPRGGWGGYLKMAHCGLLEDVFSVLAHEIRHIFQLKVKYYARAKRIRRHRCKSGRAKLMEVDASIFQLQMLRKFRREFPRDHLSPALMLP